VIEFANPDFSTGDLRGWNEISTPGRGLTGVTRYDLIQGQPVFAAFAELSLAPGKYDSEQLEISQRFEFPDDGLVIVSADIGAIASDKVDQVSFATIIDGGTFGAGQLPFGPPPSELRTRITSHVRVKKGAVHEIGFRFYAAVNGPGTNYSRRSAGYLGNCNIEFLPTR